MGCGLCVTHCPTGALRLDRRPKDELAPPPVNYRAWMQQRAEARGLDWEQER